MRSPVTSPLVAFDKNTVTNTQGSKARVLKSCLSINSEKHNCKIWFTDDLCLLVLPSFFSKCLNNSQLIYTIEKKPDDNGFVDISLKERPVENGTTIIFIQHRLEQFLNWIIEYSSESKHVSLDTHHNISDEILNYYINDVLILERGLGEKSIEQNLIALRSYYNFLAVNGVTNLKTILVKAKNKAVARDNTKKRGAVKYLTTELRTVLVKHTSSIRNELILKTGSELGLRSKENLGLLMNDFVSGGKKYLGIKSLIKIMISNPNQDQFQYHLQGKFTKAARNSGGGLSRTLYLHRSLLARISDYIDKERPDTDCNTLFVTQSNRSTGKPIDKGAATRIFAEARDKVLKAQAAGNLEETESGQKLETTHTYHILRHTFGTNKFYEFAKESNVEIDDVTPTSQVYLSVARLMGHNARDRYAPTTTKTYIRSCHIKDYYEQGL